ncbi:FlgD immunoglobulin-like domain containing protein [Burkholderia mayonis]|uniref:Basal-body rod modification protein FlgD n=1 Tax=Burkholderia mayonis TaxID=1385591 RepID=A0A1B4FQR2_9BURK|nr:FlgD immunoglobulin-like domain containing protein [Burkholderia mayonis]AOJ06003.1 flagellar biosynthesis protein FlgD [Burkholderia mayonis]KVE56930.1 flagellar biosynthesis protein FlgD [Burkholderia mayonis]
MSNSIQSPYSGNDAAGARGSDTPAPNANPEGSPADLFAKLLDAQIRNQNPLEPMDSSQFVTQLMMMQQTQAMNDVAVLTNQNLATTSSMLVVALGSQVGAAVMAKADSIEIGDETVKGRLALENGASNVTVVLTGPDGEQHRIDLGEQPKGDVNFEIDPQKHGLPPGKYEVKVETGAKTEPAVEFRGTLEGVRVAADGKVRVRVAGIGEIDVASITSFMGRSV